MKRILAVGCSHGIYADPKAVSAVLEFKRAFKPHTTIHLGDAIDATALRSGAKGTADESKPIDPDVDGGIEFLTRLEPNVFLWGNHEDRLARLSMHPSAIVAKVAGDIAKELHEACRKIKCQTVAYDGIYQGVTFGGYRYMHGVMYNESAPRDHAEAFGNCVFAHTHRTGVAVGRRSDSPKGYCVGTLTRMGAMDYAKARRSTLSWSQGFVYGYYGDNWSQLWLHEHNPSLTSWLLPK